MATFIDGKVVLPRYSIPRVFQLRDRLLDDELSRFIGVQLNAENYHELVTNVYQVLNGVKKPVVADSLSEYAGRTLDEYELKIAAWRIAGNVSRMKEGKSINSITYKYEQEWVPVQILSAHKSYSRKQDTLFRFRILAGVGCPSKMRKQFSRDFCRFLARRIGFTSRRGSRVFSHPYELVNLRLWVFLDPTASNLRGQPQFSSITMSSGTLQWNREILRMRFRQDWSCPFDYTHPCFRCHVGYIDCPAGTHRRTYELDEEQGNDQEQGS